MLKWLRKYNTFILVIAGSLLMVTFLLAEFLQSLGQGSPNTTVLVVNGEKISARELERARVEYAALGEVIGSRDGLRPFGIEDAKHWLLLVTEARNAGLIGGPADGERFVPTLARQIVQSRAFMLRDSQQLQEMLALQTSMMDQMIDQVAAGPARMDRNDVLESLSKLQGVARLRASYSRIPKLSDRRLVAEYRQIEDSAAIDYVFVPADRELRNVERPDENAQLAHFDRYKDAVAGDGEFGFGYRQPDRIKLEYLVVSRAAAEAAVSADPIEVQKRFRRKFPDGRPADGTTVDQAVEAIEIEVKREQADRVLRVAEQAVRAEFDRLLRGVPQVGPFYNLPADWNDRRPTMTALRELVTRRIEEATGAKVPPPVAFVRGEWATQTDLGRLEQIGMAFATRGPQSVPFTQVAMGVRELAGDATVALQVGLIGEALSNRAGDKIFFVITEARKASAPDSLDEVRTQVVTDLMRLEAFNRLRAQIDQITARAVSGGLTALSLTPEEIAAMTGVVAAAELPVNNATARREFLSGTAPNLDQVDQEVFRQAILSAAAKLDPTAPIDSVPAADRTVVVPIPQSLGIGVARITGLNPVTAERLRVQQARAVDAVVRGLLNQNAENDPFSVKALEARLKVEDRRPRDQRDTPEEEPANAA